MPNVSEAGIALAAPRAIADDRPEWSAPAPSLMDRVRAHILATDPEFLRYGSPRPAAQHVAPADFIYATEEPLPNPDAVFGKLRWGGQYVYATRSASKIEALPKRFKDRGFEIVEEGGCLRRRVFGFPVPFFANKVHYFVARKVHLTLPREVSERFTYHLKLVHHNSGPDGYVVLKEVPSIERVASRLRHKFPDASAELIEKRARKFTEKIFPLFLTREAAMLKILDRDLPKEFGGRVPHVIELEQDGRGYVRRLWMNWLRRAPGRRAAHPA